MKKILIFCAAIGFLSCSVDREGDDSPGIYDNGILVLNEGGFGTVNFISDDLQTVRHDIFSTVNGSQHDIGQFVQSMFFDGDRAFIISNGSNKITVVNRYTFEYVATISSGLSVPRFGVVYDGRAYVTNMASFFSQTDDYVAVINLGNLTVGNPIAIQNYADNITAGAGKIWVGNGAFGSGNSVTVIDPSTQTIDHVIQTGSAPNSLKWHDGMLYALCSAFGTDSKIVRIDAQSFSVVDQVVLPAGVGYAMNLDIHNGTAYFTGEGKIFKMYATAESFDGTPLVDTQSDSDYMGYGFAVGNDRIFISEAAEDFSSDGRVLVYTISGELIAEIPAGLGPNGFYFN